MSIGKLACGAAVAVLGLSAGASASTVNYVADLVDINNLGASGHVRLSLDEDAGTLRVRVQAAGLEPGVPHVQHIHGVPGGDSITPTAQQDTDGDGFVELSEGAATYGPIVLSLTDDTIPGLGGFPTAPDGTIDFRYTYDLLTTPAFSEGSSLSDLLPLTDREIVIHGAILPFEVVNELPGLGGGIADDGNGNPIAAAPTFNPALPVLAGEIQLAPVPLPAGGLLLLAGLGALGIVRRRKGATA